MHLFSHLAHFASSFFSYHQPLVLKLFSSTRFHSRCMKTCSLVSHPNTTKVMSLAFLRRSRLTGMTSGHLPSTPIYFWLAISLHVTIFKRWGVHSFTSTEPASDAILLAWTLDFLYSLSLHWVPFRLSDMHASQLLLLFTGELLNQASTSVTAAFLPLGLPLLDFTQMYSWRSEVSL